MTPQETDPFLELDALRERIHALERENTRLRAAGAEPEEEAAALGTVRRKLAARSPAETISALPVTTPHGGLRLSSFMRLQEVLDASPDAILIVGEDGTIAASNEAATELFGHPAAKFTELSVSDLLPARFRGAHDGLMQGYRESPQRRPMDPGAELWALRADGSEFRAEIALSPYQGGAGVSVIASIRDVTHQRSVEADLRDSLRRYRALVETNVAIVAEWRGSECIYMNGSIASVLGYSSEEWLSLPLEDRYDPDDLHPWELDWNNIADGDPQVVVFRARASDGSWKTLTTTVVAYTDEEGERRSVTHTIDVTAKVQAEAALIASESRVRVSEARHRALTETSGGLVVEWTFDGRRTYLSDHWEELTGYTPEDAAAFTPNFAMHPEDEDLMSSAVARAIRGESVAPVRHRFRVKSRDYRWFETALSIYAAAEGDGRLVFLMRDLTEQLALEEQLQEKQKLEALGKLAGGVAHDFNNALMVMGGYADALLERLPSGSIDAEDAATIQSSVRRAADLTQQLLAFGRRQTLNPRTIDASEVVEETGRILSRVISAEVEVRLIAPGPLHIWVDRAQLEHALLNLAINAADAMPTGGILTISLLQPDADATPNAIADLPPGDYCAITVQDTGVGMDASLMEHIFEPFFTTKPEGSGTGLGLAGVYGFAHQSGGTVLVDSEPGIGSTFTIYLPTRLMADESETPSEVPDDPQSRPLSILIVEDEEAVRHLLDRLLTAAGHQVITAPSADAARAAWDAAPQPFDLLLTDMVMPGERGTELAASLREMAPSLPVIYLSGYAYDEAEMEPSGTSLTKPVSRSALLRAVQAAVPRSTPKIRPAG